MKQLKKLKPAFWDHHAINDGHGHSGLNFAKKWRMIVAFTSLTALLPLVILVMVEFGLTHQVMEDEIKENMQLVLQSALASISASADPKNAAKIFINQVPLKPGNDLFIARSNGSPFTEPSLYKTRQLFTVLANALSRSDAGSLNTNDLIISYAKIPDTELNLVYMTPQEQLSRLWFKPRVKLVGYLVFSVLIILFSIMGIATYLVGRIHNADRERAEALHHAEYANKLASIGRLASGVAHEINNPLAIINQKNGLLSDLLAMRKDLLEDERFLALTTDITEAVTRAGTITKQLLDFARDMELDIEPLEIDEVIHQVLAFLNKEAKNKNILINVDIDNKIQGFECDRGSLQQIFLNLFNNAFAAMADGGKLDIQAKPWENEQIIIRVTDTGCGINNQNVIKIFEPFYSSKKDHHTTGMGLSITYGLVRGIGGDIRVHSTVGEGTRFTIILPLKATIDTNPESSEHVVIEGA